MDRSHSDLKRRVAYLVYGALAYGLFLVTFCYAIGFISNAVVPKSIDIGRVEPARTAILINVALLSLFVIQHTVMARPAFKAAWTRIVPPPIERSTFVLATCGVLGLLFWQWRPLPALVWNVELPALRYALHGLAALGWLLVLYSSFLIDHFDLFGLRQVVLYWRGRAYTHPGFATPWLYRVVRNPLMLGFITAFWATPSMSQGRLLFAGLATGYILIGIAFEERDLSRMLGEDYRRYRARTPMLIPIPRRGAAFQAGGDGMEAQTGAA